MSPTLATRLPHVELCWVAVESPISSIIRYLSPLLGLVGAKVVGLIIFKTFVKVLPGIVSLSIVNKSIVSSNGVVAIVPTISFPVGCVSLIWLVPFLTFPYCSNNIFQLTGGPKVSNGSILFFCLAPVWKPSPPELTLNPVEPNSLN